MRFWFHTQQDLGTYYARIGGARSENEVRHERWSMLDYNADGTRISLSLSLSLSLFLENDKECLANKTNIGYVDW